MARHPERPLIQLPTGPPARRSGRVVLLARGAARHPLRTAIVVVPIALVAVLVVISSMVLFIRNIEASVKGCGDPSTAQATPVSSAVLSGGPEPPGPGEPPRNFIPAYFAAANQPDAQLGPLGPYVLMGIHKVESGFGRSTLDGVHSGANFLGCCKGPFQFYDVPGEWSTWLAKSPVSGKTYARDGNGDGKADIYDNVDSMFAAGALLYASGAPGDWKRALFSYNRSTAYGEEVLAHAREYQARVRPPGDGGDSRDGGTSPDGGTVVAASYSPDAARLVADTTTADTTEADNDQPAECGPQPEEIVAPADAGPYSPPMAAGSYTITTKFWTWRGSYNHQGADLAAPEGTPFRAIGDGKVTIAGPYDPDGYGTYICVEHTLRLKSCYGHPSRVDVEVGEMVKRGQVIGAVGQEGNSTGPHLHFEVWLDGAVVCPANYFGTSREEWCTGDAPGYKADPGSEAQPA